MKLIRFRNAQITEEKIMDHGHHYIEAALDEVVLFVRRGHILPLASGGKNTAEVDWDHLEFCHFAESGTVYELYNDDGTEKNPDLNDGIRILSV